MSALAANKTTKKGKVSGRNIPCVIKNTVTVYEGGLCGVDSTGTALPMSSTTAGLQFLGECERGGTGNSGGTVVGAFVRRGTGFFTKASASAADLGKMAYALDDQTVATVKPSLSGAYDYPVGQIIQIVDANTVEIDYERTTVKGRPVRSISVQLGTISATAAFNVVLPAIPGTITGVSFATKDAQTADDTNYWTWGLVNKGAAGSGTTKVVDSTAAANSTKATGGSAVTGYVKRDLTLSGTAGNLNFAAGDVLELTVTKAASAANMTQSALRIDYDPTEEL